MRRLGGVASDFESLRGRPGAVTKRIERFSFFVLKRLTTDEKVGQGSLPTLNNKPLQSESKGLLCSFRKTYLNR
jgi:hypothetical protein